MTSRGGWGAADAAAALDRIEERERLWLQELERCSCTRVLLDRAYLGRLSCAHCAKLTRFPSRRRS